MRSGARPLPEALELFRELEESGIRHCQFKSNEHLGAGLAGETDLDVLVDPAQWEAAEETLVRLGFKRFPALHAAAYPPLVDYLGFSGATGRLVHVHLHYVLLIGESYLKNWRIPWQGALLRRSVIDEASGVRVSDPRDEMLLLLIRLALKLRWRDVLLALGGRPLLSRGTLAEYEWLRKGVEPETVVDLARHLIGDAGAEEVRKLVSAPPSMGPLRRLRTELRSVLSLHRTYGRVEATARRMGREFIFLAGAANRRWLSQPRPVRRIHPRGGLLVAFLGPDGSGKSTVAAEIRRWLGWKLDVHAVYFGSGDGPASLARWPLRAALRLRRRGEIPASRASSAPHGSRPIGPARLLWALVLAHEKRSKVRTALRARARGMVVLCDRYPQVQVQGFNDGPLLARWLDHPWGVCRRLARWESSVYHGAACCAPDLTLKLVVAPEIAASRKSDLSREAAERRLAAVRRIDYGPACAHLEIDTSRPLEEVLVEVKREIWKRL